MSEQIYPYAVSKIRVKELNLLTKHELENLAEEVNLDRIKSVLIDKGYNFELIEKMEYFEIVLKNETIKLYNLVKELIPEQDFANIFLCKNDYNNVKLILKAKIVGKEYENSLIDAGIMELSKLKEGIENEDYSLFSKYMQEGIKRIKNIPEYENNPYVIDCILDAKSFEEMKEMAETTKCDFIIKYVKKLINLINIKTFFRIAKTFGRDKKLFDIAYIEGGDISKEVFLESLSQDIQNSRLKYEGIKEIYDQALYNSENFDKFCDNYIMDYMKESKLKALTIEPIVAYIYAKETEIKNIRIILTGKLNNINSKMIKERLRESYV